MLVFNKFAAYPPCSGLYIYSTYQTYTTPQRKGPMSYRRRTTKKAARRLKSRGLKQLLRRPLQGLFLLGVALFLFLEADKQRYDDTPPMDIFTGQVVKVSDGDTVTIKKTPGGLHVKVRLYGIDAPEAQQPYYIESKKILTDLLYRRTVQVEQQDKDQYGRIVGRIFVSGQAVDKEMVRTGQAWFYPQFCRITICQELQDLEIKAKEQGVGLWQQPNPTPPWAWRQDQKK